MLNVECCDVVLLCCCCSWLVIQHQGRSRWLRDEGEQKELTLQWCFFQVELWLWYYWRTKIIISSSALLSMNSINIIIHYLVIIIIMWIKHVNRRDEKDIEIEGKWYKTCDMGQGVSPPRSGTALRWWPWGDNREITWISAAMMWATTSSIGPASTTR